MHRIAVAFIARQWWRLAQIWLIAMLLIAGGGILGYQACQWALAAQQVRQLAEVRQAYDTAMKERDKRLDDLTRKTGTAADKANAAATTATQAADKAIEAVDRASQ